MTIVPQGNVSPTRRATNPDSQNRAIPPKTLPKETQITPSIVSTVCLDLLSHLYTAQTGCRCAPDRHFPALHVSCQDFSHQPTRRAVGAHHFWLARDAVTRIRVEAEKQA
jgi:hypothetical protein